MENVVNQIFKVMALYGNDTWADYVEGLLPQMKSAQPDIYHMLNGLLQLHQEGQLPYKLVRKTVLDICNALNPKP